MFYVMFDKTTKQVLNYGSSQDWADKSKLSNYKISDCEEVYPISPIEYDLREVCTFDDKNRKFVVVQSQKDKADKYKEADILIEDKKNDIAKQELIDEGVLNPDGTAK